MGGGYKTSYPEVREEKNKSAETTVHNPPAKICSFEYSAGPLEENLICRFYASDQIKSRTIEQHFVTPRCK